MNNQREVFQKHAPTFGPWLNLANPVICEIVSRAGYDWAILDSQHGNGNPDTLHTGILALEAGSAKALVRVGGIEPVQIMRALDLGAVGILVPTVNNPEDAKIAAQAVRFPPLGTRSFGPMRDRTAQGHFEFKPLCILMIESKEGLENIEAIADTPDIDGLFLGPMDLSVSLGFGPRREMSQEIWNAIDQVVQVCRKRNLISGSAALSINDAQTIAERGIAFVAVGTDVGFVRRSVTEDVRQLKEWRAGRQT